MTGFHFPAVEISAANYDRQHGEAGIFAKSGGGDEFKLTFPADDIPHLMLLLSQANSDHIALSGHSMGQILAVDRVQLLHPTRETIRLQVRLAAGFGLQLEISLAVAERLCDDLRAALDPG